MSLAIFDLDNTLIAGDSDHSWGQYLVRRQLVDADDYCRRNDQFYRDYQDGCLDIGNYLKFALKPLTRFDSETLDQLHREFMAEVIEPLWLPKAEALLQQHREAGDFLLVITSTNRFVVEPICQRLGVDDLIASEPEIIDGRYSGNIIGVPSYQDGKVTRLNAWLAETGREMAGASFYSDSINDLPLLEIVDRPVAVDPCPALQKTAEERDWEIISLR